MKHPLENRNHFSLVWGTVAQGGVFVCKDADRTWSVAEGPVPGDVAGLRPGCVGFVHLVALQPVLPSGSCSCLGDQQEDSAQGPWVLI